MEKDTRLAAKINNQLNNFTQAVCKDMRKPKRKFVSQMLFGIQVARDIKLSEITRSLEEDIKLIKTETRLSRNLKDKELWLEINEQLLKQGARRVEKDTVVALDLTSIEKTHARKMDFLAKVWDGVTKETVNGYWAIEAACADTNRDWVAPLYAELYSCDAADFESENELMLNVMRKIYKATGHKGIFTIDRGGDRKEIINPMVLEGIRFVIRLNLNRRVKLPGCHSWISLKEAADNLIPCLSSYRVKIDNQGCEEKRELTLGMARVKLAGIDREINIVVVKGFGKDPLVMVTSENKAPAMILEIYLTRWKVEESFRFLKQEYGIEDVRVRNYYSLKNTFALLTAVFFFLSVYLGKRLKLSVLLEKICEKAKRFFQIPTFNQYALADGVYRILFGTKWVDPWSVKPPPKCDNQLTLDFMRN